MRSSEYFRAQARLYRDIASLMSDREAADNALCTAAEYLERAQTLEREERAAQDLLDMNAPRRARHGGLVKPGSKSAGD